MNLQRADSWHLLSATRKLTHCRYVALLDLDRLYGNEYQVVDETDLALHEGLAILDSGEQAVMARFGEGALANFLFGDEQSSALLLIGILRAVGHQRGVSLFDKWRDVHHETGTDVGVEAGVDDFEGAMRCRVASFDA
jgi:hypothetical protein